MRPLPSETAPESLAYPLQTAFADQSTFTRTIVTPIKHDFHARSQMAQHCDVTQSDLICNLAQVCLCEL